MLTGFILELLRREIIDSFYVVFQNEFGLELQIKAGLTF